MPEDFLAGTTCLMPSAKPSFLIHSFYSASKYGHPRAQCLVGLGTIFNHLSRLLFGPLVRFSFRPLFCVLLGFLFRLQVLVPYLTHHLYRILNRLPNLVPSRLLHRVYSNAWTQTETETVYVF